MDTSKNERVRSILKYYNLKPNEFASRLELDRATKVYNIVNDKTGVSVPMFELITKKFADVNPEWLMTGEGKMIKEKRENMLAEPLEGYGDQVKTLKNEIESLKNIIKSQEVLIKHYSAELAKKRKK
jgi:plasmid maintenance system antidote protein VapI